MNASDYQPFLGLLERAAAIFKPPSATSAIADDYWRALERMSFTAVEAGLDKFIEQGVRFPKPAEWREACPKGITQKAAYAVLSPTERREYLDAQKAGWEGEPCGCRECQRAGVADKPMRYVPNADEERAWLDDARQTWVVRGSWIHGAALGQFYQAQADFYEQLYRVIKRQERPRGNGRMTMTPLVESAEGALL